VDLVPSGSVRAVANALGTFANRFLKPHQQDSNRLMGLDFEPDNFDLTARHVAKHEINISGNHVLMMLASAFCLGGPLVWAFVRYWVFAP
jgi:hypothetical protein